MLLFLVFIFSFICFFIFYLFFPFQRGGQTWRPADPSCTLSLSHFFKLKPDYIYFQCYFFLFTVCYEVACSVLFKLLLLLTILQQLYSKINYVVLRNYDVITLIQIYNKQYQNIKL